MQLILSIFPGKLEAERPGYEPTPIFEIEAAEKGSVSILHVRDSKVAYYGGHKRTAMHFMPADVVADDLINYWRTGLSFPNLPPTASIGLWKMEVERIPTQGQLKITEEYRAAVGQLIVYAQFVVSQAQAYSLSPALRRDIGPLHHLMAAHLNIENQAWQASQIPQEMKQCPYCGSSMGVAFSVCTKCSRVTDPTLYAAAAAKHGLPIDAPAVSATPVPAEPVEAATTAA